MSNHKLLVCSSGINDLIRKSGIGFKARELTFEISRRKALLAMEQITCLVIDQIRDNLQIKMPWQIAAEEKTVGTFGNMKSATNIKSLQHAVRQWLFLSKGQRLVPTDPLGIDGWVIDIFTEKNKLAPSQYYVPVVFDKKYGIHPRLSEYWFLMNKTKTENKLYPKDKKMPYSLLITGTPTKRSLDVINPQTGELLYNTTFHENKFLDRYDNDQEFKAWFDYAVNLSVQERIIHGMFRTLDPLPEEINSNSVSSENVEDSSLVSDDSPLESENSNVDSDLTE